MSAFAGPSRVTGGLVFDFDMSNRNKSWLGKPTTNTCSFGTYDYGYNSTKISNATPPLPPPITGYPIYKITSNDGNDAQQILYTATVDQVNGGTYTHSAYVYLESGTWVSAGQHWNPWDYGTQQYIPKGVWTRIEDPVTNSGSNYGNVALCYNTNGAVYVTASQYETGSFATPFVGGTRSSTQAITDLTKQNVVTVNNLTYNSNGTFSIDNVASSTFNIPDSTLIRPSSVTVSAWVYMSVYNPLNDFDGSYPTIAWKGYDGQAGSQASYALTLIAGGFPRLTIAPSVIISAVTLPTNVWVNIVGTYTVGGAMVLYRNGEVDTTGTGPASISYSAQVFGVGTRTFDGAYQYPWNGSIGSVQLYNRALSADEVKQNFNALRGRYGV